MRVFGFRLRAAGAALACALAVGWAGPQAAAGDIAAGEKVYKKCAACHSLKAGKKRLGPSMHGVYGRQAGTFVDAKGKPFKHSKDMAAAGKAGLVWNAEVLAAYIADPKPYIGAMIGKPKAKTKMAFAGLRKAEDIENLIAFMEPYATGQEEGKR